MQKTTIAYSETGRFAQIILDYLEKADHLKPFYNRFPEISSFESQMSEKARSFTHRKVLCDALRKQYRSPSDDTSKLIERLENDHCFTVTTGHQLCLFTGPLYFIYKIVSIIKLAKELREEYPGKDVVPVFWMASEDHDFDEVNHLHLNDKKVTWESGQGGAVGRMKPEAIEEALDEVAEILGDSPFASEALNDLRGAYSNGTKTLARATRSLVHKIFGEKDLLVIDGDCPDLKELFVPTMKRELEDEFSFRAVTATSRELGEHYSMQVTPREINLFYLGDQLRERIVLAEDGKFKVLHTELEWTKDEIFKELKSHPDRFSPNVVLRPLYQEEVLPNLAYIGGGGELSYWFQLKRVFDEVKVSFPILVLRNSVLWIPRAESKKIAKLNLSPEEFFDNREKLIQDTVRDRSDLELSLQTERDDINAMFEEISERAASIDPTLRKMVLADGARAKNSLDKIEKRLMKAQKEREDFAVGKINSVFDRLFPENGLQERHANYFEFYEKYGEEFLSTLLETLDPLDFEFTLIEERYDQ